MILQKQKRWCLFFILYISLTACSSIMDFGRSDKFKPRVTAFSDAMRWSQFENAQGYVLKRNNQPPSHNLDQLSKIKITKYQFIREEPQENIDPRTTGIFSIHDMFSIYDIDYYLDGDYRLKHLRYEQLWWYDSTEETWFLDSDLPQFK